MHLGQGDMVINVITLKNVSSVDLDDCHDKCQIIISIKLKG